MNISVVECKTYVAFGQETEKRFLGSKYHLELQPQDKDHGERILVASKTDQLFIPMANVAWYQSVPIQKR